MVEALNGLVVGSIKPVPQPIEGATYARKLAREEGRLDWRDSAALLDRKVRALNPWPGTWFEHAGERIRVLAATPAAGRADAAPGTVLDTAATVACGEGALRLVRLQRAGKAQSDAASFLRGFAIPAGTVLPVPADAGA
jgi:methionyl-tRNA formyltransferase